MKAEELTYNVRKEIEMRAKSFNMTFEEYFESIDETYCISIIGDTNFHTNGGILCQSNGFYATYTTREIAGEKVIFLELVNKAKVITEAEAIKIMCDAESSVTHQIGEFSIKQLVGGGIEVRMNDISKSTQISVVPIVSNVVKIKCV